MLQHPDVLSSEFFFAYEDLCYLRVAEYLSVFCDGFLADLVLACKGLEISLKTFGDFLFRLVLVYRLFKFHI